jgi:hypothetical protein
MHLRVAYFGQYPAFAVAPKHQPASIFYYPRNPFDCVHLHAVRSTLAGGRGFRAMLEAFTAFFAVMSAGVFIAHAIDGYRSRL